MLTNGFTNDNYSILLKSVISIIFLYKTSLPDKYFSLKMDFGKWKYAIEKTSDQLGLCLVFV